MPILTGTSAWDHNWTWLYTKKFHPATVPWKPAAPAHNAMGNGYDKLVERTHGHDVPKAAAAGTPNAPKLGTAGDGRAVIASTEFVA